MQRSDLRPLFEPSGVVVVGASTNPDKLGHAMAASLATYPEVRLVNSRPGPGMYGSIVEAADSLAHGIDLAVMCVPASITAEALKESAAAGVRAALVCAGGFAEAGGVGVDYARAVDSVIAETGIRVLGPNTSGFFVPAASLFASFVPGVREFGAGSVAVVAASGGVNHVLSFQLQRSGAGVSVGVGLGAGQDVAGPEVLRYLRDHAATRSVILHVETVPDGPELLDAVRSLSEVKPVIALVVGRNDLEEFARSHTGALTTSWRTTRSVLAQAGAIIVDDEEHAVAAASALAQTRITPNSAPGVALITAQAGPGLIVADALATQKVALPRLAAATREKLAGLLPPLTYQDNPVDTGRPGEGFSEVVAAVAADPSIDILGVYAITEPVIDLPAAVSESGVIDVIPIVVGVDGPEEDVLVTRASAARERLVVVQGPTRLAQGLAAVAEDARRRAAKSGPLVELDRTVSLPDLSGAWDEIRAKELLERVGIACPPRRRCGDRQGARDALREIGGPVAVKLVDAEVLHKSDIGGVILGVRSEAELEDALDRLEAAGAKEFLVEGMAPPGVDLVVGARRDETFGPLVVVGLGGTATEIYADVAIRTAPLSIEEAGNTIDGLVARELFDGYRGGPKVDRAELGKIVTTLGALVASGSIDEIEINPLRATEGGLVALDAVIQSASDPGRSAE
jgi:acetyltransferase